MSPPSPKIYIPTSPTEQPTSPMSPYASTNTLILTQLPLECFSITYLNALREVFAKHGEIHTWAPLKSFRRAIIVFWRCEDAESAKSQLDGLILPTDPPAVVRVYRGANTVFNISPRDASQPDPYHLAPPRLEKNFLISPPGSPPIGWEPQREDPPNAAPLASDLISALTKLQLEQQRAERGGSRKGSTEIVFSPDEEGNSISVYVEDFCDSEGSSDEDDDNSWSYGNNMPSFRGQPEPQSSWRRIAPTALPPVK